MRNCGTAKQCEMTFEEEIMERHPVAVAGANTEMDLLGQLWDQFFSFITSMSIKCATELRIPDAIHDHGAAITLLQLSDALSLPAAKLPALGRLMRMLVHVGFFSRQGDAYSLTPLSQLLVSSKRTSASPFVLGTFHPIGFFPWNDMGAWFRADDTAAATPFALTHGKSLYEVMRERTEFAATFNAMMECDAKLVGEFLVKEHREAFDGIRAMVDVGGGTGALAAIVAEAFPLVKCSVLELPQVVAATASGGAQMPENLEFVEGDMFEHVPPADLLILKWVLHNWSDAECVKILKRCKEAIPCKEKGGKVLIIDVVLKGDESTRLQLFFDMMMMVHTSGKQREEHEWHSIFVEAGFVDYNVTPLGDRSLILLYP